MAYYTRVIPRDLFNEAKLLKCLGNIVIQAETSLLNIEVHYWDHTENGFDINQNPADASLYSNNVTVRVNGKHIHVFTTYNSKLNYPLYFTDPYTDETSNVFNEDGTFSPDFINFGNTPRKE